MNTFDYWYDYIVRNGRFINESATNVAMWRISTVNGTTINAFFNNFRSIQIYRVANGQLFPSIVISECGDLYSDLNEIKDLISLRALV